MYVKIYKKIKIQNTNYKINDLSVFKGNKQTNRGITPK